MRKSILLSLMAVAACVPSRDAPTRRTSASIEDPAPPPTMLPPTTSGASFVAASAIVSRGKHVTDTSAAKYSKPESALDDDPNTAWNAGTPSANQPASMSIDVGTGPSRLLLKWNAGGSYNYNETDYGSPGAYRIEVSADSSNGNDGAWKLVADDPAVQTHAGERSFDFTGNRWVKFTVTGVPASSPNGVQIDDIELHDVSKGATDTWFFMGDSITAFAFGNSCPKGKDFASRIHERHPRYSPVVIAGGIGGETSRDGAGHVEDWLAKNPDLHFWAIEYGTNDAVDDSESNVANFKANMQTIVRHLKDAGRVPILATVPYASDGKHPGIARINSIIQQISDESSLPHGPDLYAWFLAHPNELKDGIHPNDEGIASINRLWAEAVDHNYAP